MNEIRIDQLLSRYDVFLVDAYGVLITSTGMLPGAAEFLQEVRRLGKKTCILTNDASRTPETCLTFYKSKGLTIHPGEVVSAGMTIAPAFSSFGLKKPICAVLGTDDTVELVRRAGGVPVAIECDRKFDAVVIGDDTGFDFLPTMNALLTSLHRSLRDGHQPLLFVPNPDLLYQVAKDAFGFTSGSLAKLLELGLNHLHPQTKLDFHVLGKPEPWIYETALRQVGVAKEKAVMLGDQLATDIAGAKRAGIAAALVTTGITQWPLRDSPAATPEYVLHSLMPGH